MKSGYATIEFLLSLKVTIEFLLSLKGTIEFLLSRKVTIEFLLSLKVTIEFLLSLSHQDYNTSTPPVWPHPLVILQKSDWRSLPPHLFLSSDSTTICLFFWGGGEGSAALVFFTTTFSRVVTLDTLAVTECVSFVCSLCTVVTASEI